MSLPHDSVLSPGALVLVTGANGFVGSHVADQFLAFGFKVRGTVRNHEKAAWMQELFNKKYGAGNFELVEVRELDKKGSLDDAIKGCEGVAHTAANISMSPDPNLVVNDAVNLTMTALDAAARTPSVKRVVITSSSAAVDSYPKEPYDLTAESWNEKAVEEAWKPPPYEEDRVYTTYAASKVQSEQAAWRYVRDTKPHFVLNAVLPDFVCGPPLSVERQGFSSSIMVLKWLFDNQQGYQFLPVQYMIDASDNAALHVAALMKPDAENERIFGFAHVKTWNKFIEILHKLYPDRSLPDPDPNEGDYLGRITAQPRAESLLKWLGRPGWKPMEQSLREATEVMI